MKSPKPMPAESVASCFQSRPCIAMKRMRAMSMPSPPQSRWAKWILPPPSWGQPLAARMDRTTRIVAIAVTRNSSMSRAAKTLRTKKERFAVGGGSLVMIPPLPRRGARA